MGHQICYALLLMVGAGGSTNILEKIKSGSPYGLRPNPNFRAHSLNNSLLTVTRARPISSQLVGQHTRIGHRSLRLLLIFGL